MKLKWNDPMAPHIREIRVNGEVVNLIRELDTDEGWAEQIILPSDPSHHPALDYTIQILTGKVEVIFWSLALVRYHSPGNPKWWEFWVRSRKVFNEFELALKHYCDATDRAMASMYEVYDEVEGRMNI